MIKQKGNTNLWIILAVVVIIAVVAYLVANKGGSNQIGNVSYPYQPAQTQTAQTSDINTPQDLNTASSDLDSSDLSSIDNTLSQNDSDSSSL